MGKMEFEMFLILFICWIIFNGKFTLEIALVGLFVTALIYAFMCKFLSWSLKKDMYMVRLLWFAITYMGVLIIEIVKAVLATTGALFNERQEVQPVIVQFDTDISSNVLRVVLANSITLTPGTITVSLEKNHYTVHALDENFAVQIDESIFVTKLREADKILQELKGETA